MSASPERNAIALDRDGVAHSRAGERLPLDPPPTDGAAWASLETALQSVQGGTTSGTLHVALLAPWCEVRPLPLPPIGDDDLVQLVTRASGRYFVGARGPQVVGVVPRRRGEPRDAPRVVAAAGARLVSAIEAAAHRVGWHDVVVVPAEVAWAAATARFWPSRRTGVVALLVATAEQTTLVEAVGGVLCGARRFRAGDRDADLVAGAVRDAAGVAVIGADPMRQDLVRAFAARSIALQPVPAEWTALAADPAALAAQGASWSRGPLLSSAVQQDRREASIRRRAWQLAGLAAAIVVAAGAVEWWGAGRELAAVQAERAKVRPAVEATLVGRSSLEEAYGRLAELLAAERAAPRWSLLLADFAARVPEDAHLTGFRARGDSLVLDGLAGSAAEVFAALEESPALANLRASAPVRRQAPDGEGAMERFTIAAIRQPVRVEAP